MRELRSFTLESDGAGGSAAPCTPLHPRAGTATAAGPSAGPRCRWEGGTAAVRAPCWPGGPCAARGRAGAGRGRWQDRGLPAARGGGAAGSARAPLCLRAAGGAGRGSPHTRRRAAAHDVPGSRGSLRAAGVSAAAEPRVGRAPLLWAWRRGRLLSRGRGGARRGPGGGAGQHDRGLPPRCARRRHPSATLMLRDPALQI